MGKHDTSSLGGNLIYAYDEQAKEARARAKVESALTRAEFKK